MRLTQYAARAWTETNGAGARECSVPKYTPAQFDQKLVSPFGRHDQVSQTRSFNVSTAIGMVHVHTSGRRPSSTTVHTLRAATAVFLTVYGPWPHKQELDVLLVENGTAKVFPVHEHVDVHHINSGFSVGNCIAITRCAEMHRTIVHELVHAWRAHGKDMTRAQAFAHTHLGAPAHSLLTEAFVEAVTWLVHGGFCGAGLNVRSTLAVARSYLQSVNDDGRTNGWAYFVGKALLVSDGGHAFHKLFFPHTASPKRLTGLSMHMQLVYLMHTATTRLGGTTLPRAPAPTPNTKPVMCACQLGPAFEPTAHHVRAHPQADTPHTSTRSRTGPTTADAATTRRPRSQTVTKLPPKWEVK